MQYHCVCFTLQCGFALLFGPPAFMSQFLPIFLQALSDYVNLSVWRFVVNTCVDSNIYKPLVYTIHVGNY